MIEHVLCSDVENDQFYIEVRWNPAIFAEVWFDRDREAYAVSFYNTGSDGAPLNNAPDLQATIRALDHAREMLASRGQPQVN
jgi:hypothetical protein